MSKEIKTVMGTPTETNGSSPTAARQGRNQHRSKPYPLDVGDSCMAGVDCRATGSGTRTYPYCLHYLLGNLFSLDEYLTQPRYNREGLGPFPKQCALPFLRSGWGGGGAHRGNGKR